MAYHAWIDPIAARVPPPLLRNAWFVVADTSTGAESWGNMHPASEETALGSSRYTINGRSLVLLIER